MSYFAESTQRAGKTHGWGLCAVYEFSMLDRFPDVEWVDAA